jgi:UDP-2,4-diacetamido-2,4,6-trideoxy-beta-L-altropyranose hydrolase
MKILVRCDSGSHIGNGHVMRCVTLCGYLINQDITFVSKDFKNNIINKIKYPTLIIPVDEEVRENIKINNIYEDWLGESYSLDFIKVAKLLNNEIYDLLIVDSYSLDYRWEKLMRQFVSKILVIDDLYNYHNCNYLINSNCTDKTRYQNFVPENCEIFTDLIINNSFYSDKIRTKDYIYKVLVYMGTSPDEINKYIVETLLKFKKEFNLFFEIILVKYKYENLLSYDFISQSELINLYNECDLCIGSAGVSAIERLVMRIPSINICIVDNQKSNDKVVTLYLHEIKELKNKIKFYFENYKSITDKLNSQTFYNSLPDTLHDIISKSS